MLQLSYFPPGQGIPPRQGISFVLGKVFLGTIFRFGGLSSS